jgi:hypothetical protein
MVNGQSVSHNNVKKLFTYIYMLARGQGRYKAHDLLDF